MGVVDTSTAPGAEASQNVMTNAAFYRLFDEAEQVRWQITAIPWHAIEKEKVPPAWLQLVRDAAWAELTTFQATERFLKEFHEDIDFSQWLSVWLYEETKHPYALMRWLSAFGQQFDKDFILEGRETHPFMKSQVGTLCTNICSELVASARYLIMYEQSPEPVLKTIMKYLAADEARHASQFFTYARRLIDASENRQTAIIHALSVLHFWVETSDRLTHPARLALDQDKKSGALDESFWDAALLNAHRRMFGMFSSLTGQTLRDKADVERAIGELSK